MSSSLPQGSLPDVYRMPRLGLDTNDPEEDTSARRSEDGDSEREDAPEVADDAEEVVVVAAENAEDGVLGPEEESIPTRGDENSMLFQILISSRELIALPPGPLRIRRARNG